MTEDRYQRLLRLFAILVPMARDHNPQLPRAVVDLAAAEGFLSCRCERLNLGENDECVFAEPCPKGYVS